MLLIFDGREYRAMRLLSKIKVSNVTLEILIMYGENERDLEKINHESDRL